MEVQRPDDWLQGDNPGRYSDGDLELRVQSCGSLGHPPRKLAKVDCSSAKHMGRRHSPPKCRKLWPWLDHNLWDCSLGDSLNNRGRRHLPIAPKSRDRGTCVD